MHAAWQPDAIVFVGLQASGKSTFYKERFFATHLRINLDMLKTRHRERLLLRACIEMQQPFVVDNTNLTIADRAKYIAPARRAGFRIIGYVFPPDLKASIARNERRAGREHIPVKGIIGASRRLQAPSMAEGFDMIHEVRIKARDQFVVTQYGA